MLLRLVPLSVAAAFLVACGPGPGVEPTTTTELSAVSVLPSDCQGGKVEVVGQPVELTIPTHITTSTCHCKDTNEDWLGRTQCESEYDLGAPNPSICTEAELGAKPLEELAISYRSFLTDTYEDVLSSDPPAGCSASIGESASDGVLHVTVQCATAQSLTLNIHGTYDGDAIDLEDWVELTFTADGKCPASGSDTE